MEIIADRVTARTEEDFVVFLIGMRINKPWKFWQWLPIMGAMPKMLKELGMQPERGFLGSELWFGRTMLTVQYWRSAEDLQKYALDKDSEHLPAWRAFNRRIGTSGDVGIFHETYPITRDGHEVVYVNMPRFGLGKVSQPVPAVGRLHSAKGRLSKE